MSSDEFVPKVDGDDIRRFIQRDFDKHDVPDVFRILDEYLCDIYQETNRVRASILKLSNGDLKKLSHYTKLAKLDFRDIIYWAEYPSFAEAWINGDKSAVFRKRKDLQQKDWAEYKKWFSGAAD